MEHTKLTNNIQPEYLSYKNNQYIKPTNQFLKDRNPRRNMWEEKNLSSVLQKWKKMPKETLNLCEGIEFH